MALRGALDAEYRMEVDPYDTVRLFCSKMKDHQKPEPLAFQIRTVELGIFDEDGDPVTSAILDRIDYEPPATSKPKTGKHQKTAQAELERLCQDQGLLPDDGVLFEDWKTACIAAGIPANRFHDLKKKFLVRDGYVYQS